MEAGAELVGEMARRQLDAPRFLSPETLKLFGERAKEGKDRFNGGKVGSGVRDASVDSLETKASHSRSASPSNALVPERRTDCHSGMMLAWTLSSSEKRERMRNAFQLKEGVRRSRRRQKRNGRAHRIE